MVKSPRRLKQVQESVGEQVRDLPLHAVRLAMFGVGRALLLSDRVTKDYKEITEGGGVKPVLGRLRDDVQHTAEHVVTSVVEKIRGAEEEPEPAPVRTRTAPAPARARTAVAEPPARARAGSEISVGKPGAAKPQAKPAAEAARPKPAAAAKPAPKPEPKAAEPAPKAEAKPEAKPAAKPEPKAKAEPQPEPKPEPKAAAKPDLEPKPEAKPAAQAEAEKIAADLPVPDYDKATLPQLRARLRGLSADQVKLLREYERKHAARADVLRMYENRIAKLNGTS
ncbi:hypothetical protein [Spirillospora sp. NPDC047279]|uniref:hypothetical protein n=1 Tax=Spirillospora sp. NPDC047279 TaxID=3155478 RepID=UPI0033C49221